MEKITPGTPDLTQENVEKIAALFPNAVTEATDADGNLVRAIDFDALRENLTCAPVVEGARERYQFTWPGKRESKLEARRPTRKVMRPQPEKSKDWDTTQNLYIEGDNLEALKIMRETYAGKVKLIYIDPPYNTGHDFVYDDDFSQTREEYEAQSGDFDETGGRLVANLESNGRFHSDWCSMMYPRLLLARDLLAADGAIFISIDDNESANLRKICDEVFTPGSFIAEVACVNKPSGRSDDKYIATAHESIVIYAKSDSFAMGGFEPDETITSRYTKRDASNRLYRYEDLRKRGTNDERRNRPNLFYPFFYNAETGDIKIGSNEDETPSGYIRIVPMKTAEIEGSWRWGKETAREKIDHLHAVYMENKRQWSMHEVQYLDERGDVKPTSVWAQKDVNSERGTEAFKALGFKTTDFSNPKPIGTLKRILQIASEPDSLVLDFFSGSASMAQAVMEKNAEDGGSRRFILVQIPEETSGQFSTLTEVGEERIRRAGARIADEVDKANEQLELGAEPKPLPDLGFRVLAVGDSVIKDEYAEPGQYEQASLDLFANNAVEGATDLDLLFQVLPAFRIPYSASIAERTLGGKRVLDVNEGQLIACFDTGVGVQAIEAIAKERPLYAVFRDACFAGDSDVANLEELFKTFSPDTIRKVI